MTNREHIIQTLGGISFNARAKLRADNHYFLDCPNKEPENCELWKITEGFEYYTCTDEDDLICANCKNEWLSQEYKKEG